MARMNTIQKWFPSKSNEEFEMRIDSRAPKYFSLLTPLDTMKDTTCLFKIALGEFVASPRLSSCQSQQL